MFKVFSAKYFPSGNILNAIVHPRCSYAWQRILQPRDVINKGVVWRVGDGGTIDVWGHRWLPTPDHNKVISPRLDSPVVHVKDLFYPGTRIWDLGLLERTFLSWEVEMIKVILVSEGQVEDLLTWPLAPNGNYSVRSAYRMLMDEVSSQEPGTSMEELQQVWKGIWKI